MGLKDRLLGGGSDDDADDDGPREFWRVVAIDAQDNTRAPHPDGIDDGAWQWDQNPPDKKVFEFEYGDQLEPGRKYSLLPQTGNRPDFDSVEWTIHVEADPYQDGDDEIRREIQQLREEMNSGVPAGEDMEETLISLIAQEQGPGAALHELKEMKAVENGGNTDYFSDADLDNKGEVATAAFMNMAASYDSLGDAVEDVMGGVLGGATDAMIGPGATVQSDAGGQQQPAQPAQETPQAPAQDDDGDEWTPGAQEAFEDAQADQANATRGMTESPAPEDALDISGTEPSEETRQEFDAAVADGGNDAIEADGAGADRGDDVDDVQEASDEADQDGAGDDVDDDGEAFECEDDDCTRTFETKEQRDGHMQVHTGDDGDDDERDDDGEKTEVSA